MVEIVSPLGAAYRPGVHGNRSAGSAVTLSEIMPGSIVEIAAWPGTHGAVLEALARQGFRLDDAPAAGVVTENGRAFRFARRRVLAVSQAEGLAETLLGDIAVETATLVDLSHGRTAIAVEGPKSEWVLAKLFALDFSPQGFPVGRGVASAHHDIFALIQRTAPERFELYVYRSFARSFWTLLGSSASDVGYEVK